MSSVCWGGGVGAGLSSEPVAQSICLTSQPRAEAGILTAQALAATLTPSPALSWCPAGSRTTPRALLMALSTFYPTLNCSWGGTRPLAAPCRAGLPGKLCILWFLQVGLGRPVWTAEYLPLNWVLAVLTSLCRLSCSEPRTEKHLFWRLDGPCGQRRGKLQVFLTSGLVFLSFAGHVPLCMWCSAGGITKSKKQRGPGWTRVPGCDVQGACV